MPNPNDDILSEAPPAPMSVHSTCPSDTDDVEGWRTQDEIPTADHSDSSLPGSRPHTAESQISTLDGEANAHIKDDVDAVEMQASGGTVASPTGRAPEADGESAEPASPSPLPVASASTHHLSSNWALPSSPAPQKYFSSFLRPGSRFTGTQESDKHRYNVEVNIKYVDVAESSLCGYLRIEGLTKDHQSLTTFFEGEIIGTQHGFATKHKAWGATEKSDMHHWDRFPAWRPLAKQARKQPDLPLRNWAQREHIFMRWKEAFLVPDYHVREISGASFEGFYYICFSQVTGAVSGIYYHARSEKFQRLELKHVPDRGCFPAISFC